MLKDCAPENYAIVFPGQGSQSLGMLGDLAGKYATVIETFHEASQVLGYDLWDVVQHGPVEKLNGTEVTQPALLTASVSLWKIWRSNVGVEPKFLAGHSLGEYTALVCAESITFADAIKLVENRGKLMQKAYGNSGAMVAIVGLEDDVIANICKEVGQYGILEVANYNSVGQTVLAGELTAAHEAIRLAKEQNAKVAKILPVSVPSHCSLMKPAATELAELLQYIKFSSPRIPVIHNVDVVCHNEVKMISEVLVRQLYSPVRWVETVRFMIEKGVTNIIECGPGKVLTGLNKRINSDVVADSVLRHCEERA